MDPNLHLKCANTHCSIIIIHKNSILNAKTEVRQSAWITRELASFQHPPTLAIDPCLIYFPEDYPKFSKGNVQNISAKLLPLQLLWMLLSILSTNKIILQYSHCSMTVYRWVSVSTLFLPPYYLETYVPIQFRKTYYFAFAGFCRYGLCFSAKGTWLSLMEWQFSGMKTSTISKKNLSWCSWKWFLKDCFHLTWIPWKCQPPLWF